VTAFAPEQMNGYLLTGAGWGKVLSSAMSQAQG
jgi:hypothetical protein